MSSWLSKTALTTLTMGASFLMPAMGQTIFDNDATRAAQDVGAAAKTALVNSIKQYDIPTIRQQLNSKPYNAKVEERLRDDADIYTAVLFHCAPNIAQRENIQTVDNHDLLQPYGSSYLIAWQSDEERADTLQIVYKAISQNKSQICAVLNPRKHALVMCLGGTDLKGLSLDNFSLASLMELLQDPNDATSASVALGGLVSPRSADGVIFAENVISAFRQKRPEMKNQPLDVFIFGHSQAGAILAGMMTGFAAHKMPVDRAIVIDPLGAKAAFQAVEESTRIPATIFEQAVSTILEQRAGFLENFPGGQSVGTERRANHNGHGAIGWGKYLNQQRYKAGLQVR